ncbi:hypothetical protein TNCV_3228591 [Trichonephila clavipes]|nr:hypothetical protein TNCV_3228591 [Trichonephila clavipes]
MGGNPRPFSSIEVLLLKKQRWKPRRGVFTTAGGEARIKKHTRGRSDQRNKRRGVREIEDDANMHEDDAHTALCLESRSPHDPGHFLNDWLGQSASCYMLA